MNFIIKLLLSALAVMLVAYLLPGVTVESFWTALIVAALLALLNVTLKPILIVLTIPVTILTLGLFLLVINALIILLADALISGFMVSNFWWALAFSLILSIVTSLFESIVGS
jgi:putative membrane protein